VLSKPLAALLRPPPLVAAELVALASVLALAVLRLLCIMGATLFAIAVFAVGLAPEDEVPAPIAVALAPLAVAALWHLSQAQGA